MICIRFDLSEKLMGWAHQHERLQVDELPAVLLVIAISLIWFSTRRYVEARRQLALRKIADAGLAAALAQHQRLAQQYLELQECERKALARDLHDELGQYLNVIKLDAVSIRDSPVPVDAPVSAAARAVIDNVDRVYGVVAGLIQQLRPIALDELGLAAALEHCVGDWRTRLAPATVELNIAARLERLEETRALALYRLVQEGMTNAVRHAQARHIVIDVADRYEVDGSEAVDVGICDDGRGMNVEAPRAGLGLVGMRERLVALGGSFCLSSTPGRGVTIRASIPVTGART